MKKIMSAYKCRFCGAIFNEQISGCEWSAREETFVVLENWFDPPREIIHQCNEKKIGFADLVGYEVVET